MVDKKRLAEDVVDVGVASGLASLGTYLYETSNLCTPYQQGWACASGHLAAVSNMIKDAPIIGNFISSYVPSVDYMAILGGAKPALSEYLFYTSSLTHIATDHAMLLGILAASAVVLYKGVTKGVKYITDYLDYHKLSRCQSNKSINSMGKKSRGAKILDNLIDLEIAGGSAFLLTFVYDIYAKNGFPYATILNLKTDDAYNLLSPGFMNIQNMLENIPYLGKVFSFWQENYVTKTFNSLFLNNGLSHGAAQQLNSQFYTEQALLVGALVGATVLGYKALKYGIKKAGHYISERRRNRNTELKLESPLIQP